MNPCFIKYLYCGQVKKKVQISNMTAADALWWHKNVQSFIKQYLPHRADSHWNWRFRQRVYGVIDQSKFLKITTEVDDTPYILGMLHIHTNSRFIIDKTKRSCFLWYVSTMPYHLYEEYNIPLLSGVGKALIDASICESYAANHQGRLWLHAAKPHKKDASDDNNLLNYYKKLEMSPVQAHHMINRVRKNDGRYFYYDEHGAQSAIALYNDLR